MIYGNIHQKETYAFLPAAIQRCLAFARTPEFAALATGSHPIEGRDCFVNIAAYTTKPEEECSWEAHKDYLDIHILSEGSEYIDVAFLENMKLGAYHKDSDYQEVTGKAQARVLLQPGDFLICYPEDGHEPGIAVTAPAPLKKGIFKVRI
ncbi:YhcH/YjgK/YiaL family protein [uncultured Mitsuokella sp.]|uniref:YhcH/YjgK/YiaL family protein n=1 Tax=uncultured Mitsuokella sp. TaxID=453120 RepID=UPI002625C9C8|nr:YhcH/YjgK/YiaL family protein [uncultured Mitsuokella sp.]